MATTEPKVEKKRCSKCSRRKPPAAFYKSPAARDGLRSWCRVCDRAGARARKQVSGGARVKRRLALQVAEVNAALTDSGADQVGKAVYELRRLALKMLAAWARRVGKKGAYISRVAVGNGVVAITYSRTVEVKL